ncbi:sensor histidine kinase [Rhodococcoides fascians]|uniref:sensor histidine kinase n=1 Tax=Rhodococcoides fascians TaxID=1828 RepID=UPI00050C6376|nr:ATP-binding protein [Rhodococcus fascians]
MVRLHRDLLRPRSWTVRVRSAVASTLVVAVCLIAAGGALLGVLYSSLESSARSAATARVTLIAQQWGSGDRDDDRRPRVENSLLATDGQIGIVQVVDASGAVLASSRGDSSASLTTQQIPSSEVRDLGRVDVAGIGDFWVSATGVSSPRGQATVFVGADREPVEKVVSTVALLLAAVGPFVVALVAFATYRLVGAALSPVENIRSRVASISAARLTERVPVPDTRDEIARLASTMNHMLERLEDGQRAQQRFVSDASHELRSPLATITAALELAEARPELRDAALLNDSLLPEARRMRQLIEDLLVLARSDETETAAVSGDVDLEDLLYEEAKRVQATSDVRTELSIVPVRVSGDPYALARMVRNVVDNAVRHADTRIVLSCSMSDDAAVIAIDDDGPGVPASERTRVFDRFVRLDSSRTRDEGGAGLGLAIVADTVAAHGGSVHVTDSPIGGARFEIRLPR